jgi:hypothetical protein
LTIPNAQIPISNHSQLPTPNDVLQWELGIGNWELEVVGRWKLVIGNGSS